jgi:hypothetical protein
MTKRDAELIWEFLRQYTSYEQGEVMAAAGLRGDIPILEPAG